MHLKKITLTNFRCFDSLTVDLHKHLTVLVAENAGGKTSVLDAIAKGLAAWFPYLDSAEQRIPNFPLDDGDLRITPAINNRGREVAKLADATSVALSMVYDDTQVEWDVVHVLNDSVTPSREHGASSLKSHAHRLRDAIHDGDDGIPIPVFAYYGIHRGHVTQEIPDRIREPNVDYSRRLSALVDALAPNLRDFSEMVRWFKEASLDELQWFNERGPDGLLAGDDSSYKGALPHIRKAFEAVLGDRIRNPRIDRITKKFVVDFKDDDGDTTQIRFDQLSQGYASVLALIMDLAQRLAVANPHYNAATEHDSREGVPEIIDPLSAPAIVLIDEVDLHLHPSWQQRVIGDLLRAFPGTQFIVTTHSPQVLTTVKRENIRILRRDTGGNWRAPEPERSPLGQESAEALAHIMGTHPRPVLPLLNDMHNYEQLARAGLADSPEAKSLLANLTGAGFQFLDADLALFKYLAVKKANQSEKNHG